MSVAGLLILLAVLGVACNKSTQNLSGPTANKKLRIAVIPKGTTHEFWKSVHAGALQAAEELGNVEIIWKGPLRENDREGQINVVQDFIVQKVDGIVLAPLDQTALVPEVEDARQQGIPTVIFDSGLDSEAQIVSYVATDNFAGGALAARELAKLMGGKGNAVLLRYHQGSESTVQREEGFLETIKKEFPDIVMISDNQYSGTVLEECLNKSLDVLNQFGTKMNGVFTVCEPNTVAMLAALEQENLAGKVKFVGFDPSPRLIEALAEKKIDGIVLQAPITMGYQSVKTLVAHIRGEKVEARIKTGETMATPENLLEPKIDKLLHPKQAD